MPLDELEQLLDLVRLGLAVNLLEVQKRRDSWVHEDVVAPAEVVRGSQRLLEELSRVHVLEQTLARWRENLHRRFPLRRYFLDDDPAA
jgi:hypothetical protein